MATRRIARGRGGSPVPIIVLSVLVVGLIGSTVVLGLKVGDQIDLIADAEKKAGDWEQKLRVRENDFDKFEDELIGVKEKTAKSELDELKKGLVKGKDALWKEVFADDVFRETEEDTRLRQYKTMRDLVRGYFDRSAAFEGRVIQLAAELKAAREERNALEHSKTALAKAKQDAEDAAATKLAAVQADKDKLQATLDQTRRTLTDQLAALKGEKTKLGTELTGVEKDNTLKDKEIERLKELVYKLRHPPKPRIPLVVGAGREPSDGKILTVEPDGQFVMIDVGRRDWVREGMEFSVIDDTNPESRETKGRIQIRRVYDTISQAKILEQKPLDPILKDMIVLNPAFKRGRKLRFVLEGKFLNSNFRRLLTRYPCTIEEQVDDQTDYLVIGSATRPKGAEDPRDGPSYRRAQDYGIFIYSENDMLRYLGERP